MAKNDLNIPADVAQKVRNRLRWAEAVCADLACDEDLDQDRNNLASSALNHIDEISGLLNGSPVTANKKLKRQIRAIVDKHIALTPDEKKPLVKELAAVLKHDGTKPAGDSLKDHAGALYTVETLLRDLNDAVYNMRLEISERERDSIQAMTTSIKTLMGEVVERLDVE